MRDLFPSQRRGEKPKSLEKALKRCFTNLIYGNFGVSDYWLIRLNLSEYPMNRAKLNDISYPFLTAQVATLVFHFEAPKLSVLVFPS